MSEQNEMFPSRDSIRRDNTIQTIFDGNFNRDVQTSTTEMQKTFVWMRLYLKEEYEIEPGSLVKMNHLPSSNSINIVFGAYNKKNLHKDSDKEVVEYTSEDDKKCLCLMVDIEEINRRDDINYIRTLFKDGRYFDSNNLFIKEGELTFTNKDNDIDFYSVDF